MDAETAQGWVHVPIRVIHPLKAPLSLAREFTVVFQQAGPTEPLVHAAVKTGSFMTVSQLKQLQAHLKFEMCGPGSGHGKEGKIVKRDYCDGLINYLFPHASAHEKFEMLRGLMGQRWAHLDPKTASRHTRDIIAAFEGLPSEDMKEFVELAAVASDEVLLKEKRDQKSRVEILPKTGKKHETPLTLRDLRPQVAGCRVTRHPVLKRYQGFYVKFGEKGLLAQPQYFRLDLKITYLRLI